MARTRYIAIPGGGWQEVTKQYEAPVAPMVWGDLPAYESPIDGRVVEGRVQRREDLKRSGSRPFEGIEAERKEANRHQAEHERQVDRQVDRAVGQAWAQLNPRAKKALMYR